MKKKFLFILIAIMLFGSVNSQKTPPVVSTVDIKRYAGKWYEIARLPNSFEKS